MAFDPAFAGAGAAPGLAVWRVENFKAVAVAPAFYGQFYNGDSYITLSSRRTDTGMAHDIYMWLGSETSLDESGTAAILAVQLDDSLGGLPVQHREEEGKESNEFISLFKSLGGVIVQAGGTASGFHHVVAEEYAPALLQVKGKRNVVTRQVALAATSLNKGDCFILDLGFTLYLWTGASANTAEKSKAVEVMSRVHSSRGAKTHRIVFSDASEEEQAAFWAALGGTDADVQEAVADDEERSTKVANVRLMRVSDSTGASVTVAEIVPTGGKLTKDLLPTGDVALLDVGSEVFVWVSKTASAGERNEGMRIAADYIAQSGRSDSLARVTVVREGGETPLFKSVFFQWDPVPTFDFSKKASTGVASASTDVVIDYAALAAAKGAAAMPTLPAGGQVRQWRVQGTGVTPVEPDAVGNFYAGDSYVVQYDYVESGKTISTVFFWLGRHSDNVERGTAALTARDYADEVGKAGSQASQVRVVQGSEPAFFTGIFGGLMTVHAGGAKGSAQHDGAHLFHVKGSTAGDTKAFEVPASASSLNSGDAFVLINGATATVWFGKGSNEAERASASKLGGKLVSIFAQAVAGLTAVTCTEGAEPAEFWAGLGGQGEYPAVIPPASAQLACMFEVSDASGALTVSEVHSWGQGDLLEDEVVILDGGNTVFVWVGSAASLRERTEAVTIAQSYVAAGVEAGTHDGDVPIVRVTSGSEPAFFTSLFPGWDAVATEELADPYEAKLAAMRAQQVAQKEDVDAAAAARTASRAAAVAAAEAKKASVTHAAAPSVQLHHVEPGAASKAATHAAALSVSLHHVESTEAAAAEVSSAPLEPSGPLSGVTVTHNGATYPLELLKAASSSQPGPFAGISFADKEALVGASDYTAVFGLTKAAFDALPKWKRGDTKKKAGLY